MTDEMKNDNLNKSSNQALSSSQLDQLFSKAGRSEEKYGDGNFTKMVINQLPSRPQKASRRKYLPEILGLVFGVLMTVSLVDLSQLLNRLVAWFPTNVLISPINMLIVAGVLGLLAYAAWWNVERNPQAWDF